ncbi:MAG: D-glycerate dehydrogenase [Candidatus Binataceae bacterium]
MKDRGKQVKDRGGGVNEWRVFVTRPIAEPAIRRLAATARVDLWDDEMPPPPGELRARARQADGVLSMVTDRFDAAMIRALPRLRVISNLAVGVDNIDLAVATRAGIAVGHTPGILTETTADLAFGLLMAAARRIAEGDRYVRGGRWRTWGPKVMLGRDIHGATLGIIGWGAIGQTMARRAAGFGMRVIYLPGPHTARRARGRRSRVSARNDRIDLATAEPMSLERLLAESDFVSLHVPLAAATRHMIGEAEFAMMKRTAILINTARGAIVDPQALVGALRAGRLAGAGLDVTDPEPISANDPLLKLPNVVITPHIGSASHATRLRMAELAVDNLIDVFEGRRPRHCANPAVRMR